MESARRKDFGFVKSTTREATIACTEAFIKDHELVGRDSKVCCSYHTFPEIDSFYFLFLKKITKQHMEPILVLMQVKVKVSLAKLAKK